MKKIAPGHVRKVKDKKTKKEKKNVWELRIELPSGKNGKRNYKYHRFHGTKKEADAELQRLRFKYSSSDFIEPSEMSFDEFLQSWLEEIKQQVAERTWEGYNLIVQNHIIPELGYIPLSELKPFHISSYKSKRLGKGGRLDGKPGGLTPNTVNKHLSILSRSLFLASSPEKCLISHNPMIGVTWATEKNTSINTKVKDNYLLPDQLKEMLDVLENVYFYSNEALKLWFEEKELDKALTLKLKEVLKVESLYRKKLSAFRISQMYPIVFLDAFTGMRLSEILGLKWSDISFTTKQIMVLRTSHYTKEHGQHFGSTKEKKVKQVAVSDKVLKFLKEHKKRQNKEKILLGGKYEDNDLVFARRDGQPFRNDTVSKEFIKFAKEHGFNITFHGIRHTHATLLLMSGVPSAVVAQRLGHQKTSTTEDLYAHAIPSMQVRAAHIFDNIVNQGEIITPEKMLEMQHQAVKEIDRMIQ